MDVCVLLFCVYVGSGLANCWSPVQGALPKRSRKRKSGEGPTNWLLSRREIRQLALVRLSTWVNIYAFIIHKLVISAVHYLLISELSICKVSGLPQ
jgi:hypothetical protein